MEPFKTIFNSFVRPAVEGVFGFICACCAIDTGEPVIVTIGAVYIVNILYGLYKTWNGQE